MADIVDELRDRAKWLEEKGIYPTLHNSLERRAAEEVERLRSKVSRLERESPPTIWSNDSKLPE